MTDFSFQPIRWYDELPSTNTTLRNMTGASSGTVIAARNQTAGRGRQGRIWRSGEDLTFSFLIETGTDRRKTASLPMASALGVIECLRRLGISAEAKWPNDVLVNGRKICGILAEADSGRIAVGIGLNLSMVEEMARELKATSVFIETGDTVKATELLPSLLDDLAPWINRWHCAGFASLADDWLKVVRGVGKPIRLRQYDEQGVLTGFGEWGELLLALPDGTVKHIWSDG